MNPNELTQQQQDLLDAALGKPANGINNSNAAGVMQENLLKWLASGQVTNEAGEFMVKGVHYDAEANVLRLTGVITDDLTAVWMDGDGVASPSMLMAGLAMVNAGYELHINSPGGSVFAATEMITLLRANKPAATVVTGMAASAAALVTLVGERREAGNEMAMMMFHGPMSCACGNASQMSEVVEILRKVENTMADFVKASVDAKAADDIIAAISEGRDKFYTAGEAVALGILTGVASGVKPEPAPEPDDESSDDNPEDGNPDDDTDTDALSMGELVALIHGLNKGGEVAIDKKAAASLTGSSTAIDNKRNEAQQAHIQRTRARLNLNY